MTVYEIITERITEQLDKGVVPWRKSWDPRHGLPRNLVEADALPRRQCLPAPGAGLLFAVLPDCPPDRRARWTHPGGLSRRARDLLEVVQSEEQDKEGAEEKRGRAPLLRYYTVFNLEQTQGVAAPADDARPTFAPIEACERVVGNMEKAPAIHHGGAEAYYLPSADAVHHAAARGVQEPGRLLRDALSRADPQHRA